MGYKLFGRQIVSPQGQPKTIRNMCFLLVLGTETLLLYPSLGRSAHMQICLPTYEYLARWHHHVNPITETLNKYSYSDRADSIMYLFRPDTQVQKGATMLKAAVLEVQ